uniref:SCAN box domain-containing protein n=1 Tax=Oryzias latipes TaxID=8090 RepID=A0A3B3IH26_ORYLA
TFGVRSGIAEETTKRWGRSGVVGTTTPRGVLRERRHNSPVTCCRRLRSAEVPSGRRPAGACCRWKGLSRGWDRLERRTEERVGGIAVVEQPQPVHPSDARTWVEEHAPEDSPADPCRPVLYYTCVGYHLVV